MEDVDPSGIDSEDFDTMTLERKLEILRECFPNALVCFIESTKRVGSSFDK